MDYLTHHLLRASARRLPQKEALVQGERRLSYRELDAQTDRIANALVEAGLERLDRVGILLEKSVEEVLAIVAASKAGGVFVPINHLLFTNQVEHILRDCRPKALVTTIARFQSLNQQIVDSAVEIVVLIDGNVDDPGEMRILDLRSICASEDKARVPDDRCVSKDLAAILYTSGSTGRPKGVMLSHGNLVAGSRIVSTYLEIGEAERILSVLPFSFDYGLNQLLTSLEHGATLVLLSFRFPGEVVQAVLKERVTGLAGVPSFWSVLTQPSSPVYRKPLPSLRYVTNTGGAVPGKLLDALRRALPTTSIYLMYGLTEAFRSTYLPPGEIDRRPGSMGKAIPDSEIYVIDDDGRPCKPHEAGELVHRGPTVSLGYWGQPEATAKVLRPDPLARPEVGQSELVCYSGDLVKMDEDGYLYFIGRRDATIKCSGFRISPTEIEEVLVSTGRIREAAAVGIPDEIMGQAVVAIVAPHDGEQIDVDGLISYCAETMPRYMVPKKIEIVASLPKTAHGKIDYPTLRARLTEAASDTDG
jgi:acyl-CoA ligase (AMP-forming) (exosortase A-associated)